MSGAYPNRGKYIKTIRGSVSRMELVVEVGGVTIPGRSYETKFPKIARKNRFARIAKGSLT